MDLNPSLVLPVVILASYGLVCLLFSPLFRKSGSMLGFIALVGVAMATWANFRLYQYWREGGSLETAQGLVHIDGFGVFFGFLVLIVGALSLLWSPWFLERDEAEHGEFYALILFALAGMIVMVQTTHLVVVLVGLEIFSLALYVLCGITRLRTRSVESALKYFLLGAFSSGFLVYGLALIYGAAGTLDMARIAPAVGLQPTPMLWIGMGLVLVGLAFKIALVPFHQWVPDVYQGAPTNVTGFMAAATKTVAFATLVRFLFGAFGGYPEVWVPVVKWLAILSMIVANLVALAQTDIKRLLAFSSIAHAGTLLIAVACIPEAGVSAILFYLTSYAFMTVGAFALASAVGRGSERSEQGYEIDSWAGLGRRRPVLAFAMTVFLLSLAGVPPTAGFLGKYLVFQAAIASGQYTLAVVGVLAAVVGAYYYLRVIVAMWFREARPGLARDDADVVVSPATATVLTVSVLAVFYLGLAPGRVLDLVRTLSMSFL